MSEMNDSKGNKFYVGSRLKSNMSPGTIIKCKHIEGTGLEAVASFYHVGMIAPTFKISQKSMSHTFWEIE